MAALTWYATSSKVSVHQEMSETDPGAEAYASPVTGWVTGTGGLGDNSLFFAQTERAAATFSGTTVPASGLDTTNGDALRSTNTYNGSFAAAVWTIHFCCRPNTSTAIGQQGHAICRLYRGTNANGSGATEITAAQQVASTVTMNDTTTTQDSTLAFNPGAFSVANEYIFLQLAWQRSTLGGGATDDVNMRVGNGSANGTRLISSTFTPTPTSLLWFPTPFQHMLIR